MPATHELLVRDRLDAEELEDFVGHPSPLGGGRVLAKQILVIERQGRHLLRGQTIDATRHALPIARDPAANLSGLEVSQLGLIEAREERVAAADPAVGLSAQ